MHVPDTLSTLRQCRDANRVNEEWFTDMDAVRSKVGLVDDPPGETSTSGQVSFLPHACMHACIYLCSCLHSVCCIAMWCPVIAAWLRYAYATCMRSKPARSASTRTT